MPTKKPTPSPHPTPIVPTPVQQAATAYAGITFKPAPYDPEQAKKTLDALRPALDALDPTTLTTTRLDLRGAALGALAVHAFVTQTPSLHARFKQLDAAGEFNLENLGHLKDGAFLVLYTFSQAEAAGAFATEAKAPPALIKQAAEIEARMQALCEYRFGRDPEIIPLLDQLRPGQGHQDLAMDLLGYADIYAARSKEVAADTTNYRPTDLAEARRLAGEILSHLSAAQSPRARDAYDLLQRAWTWLLRVYTEVQEVGRCLLRYDPRREERFPSLFAAGKVGRSRKKTADGPAPAPGDTGGATGTPGGA